jgi:hypothetical protein
MKVHSIKMVGMTADKTISVVLVGNLTEHDQPVGTPPEVGPPDTGTPEQPIYTPPPKPTPHK